MYVDDNSDACVCISTRVLVLCVCVCVLVLTPQLKRQVHQVYVDRSFHNPCTIIDNTSPHNLQQHKSAKIQRTLMSQPSAK